MRNSLNFTLLEGDRQIGFTRLVTDRAVFAYVADVFVLEPHRGRGLSKWLMECVRAHPEVQNLRRWSLLTKDAHGLYRQCGFVPLGAPDWHMEIVTPNPYGVPRGK